MPLRPGRSTRAGPGPNVRIQAGFVANRRERDGLVRIPGPASAAGLSGFTTVG